MATKSTRAGSKRPRVPKSSERISVRNKPLCLLAEEALTGYFSTLNGHRPGDLHEFVMGQVERPLLEQVMSYANGNQSVAAEILGLNRGTLRKKLQVYELLPK